MTAETVTQPDQDQSAGRPDRMADMPADLTPPERTAYLKGYGSGLKSYIRKHGIPSIQETPPPPGTAARTMFARRLAELGRAHVEASHPAAHAAGMRALARYRKLRGIPAPAVATQSAKVARKPRKETPAADATPVESPAKLARKTSRFDLCDAHDGNRLSRRDLARWFAEGGLRGPCSGKLCRVIPGADFYGPSATSENLWHGNPPEVSIVDAARESGRLVVIPVTAPPADPPAVPDVPDVVDQVDPAGFKLELAGKTRRAARKELAAMMRAAGVTPAGPDWEAAKAQVGLS